MDSESQIEDVVVLKIPLFSLHEGSIRYDWNNRCEYQDDIVSRAYTLNITANVISVASTSDEDFVICDYILCGKPTPLGVGWIALNT